MIVWTPGVLSVLYACVLYFCICPCSAQLSMFHMERRSRYMLIIIIISSSSSSSIINHGYGFIPNSLCQWLLQECWIHAVFTVGRHVIAWVHRPLALWVLQVIICLLTTSKAILYVGIAAKVHNHSPLTFKHIVSASREEQHRSFLPFKHIVSACREQQHISLTFQTCCFC